MSTFKFKLVSVSVGGPKGMSIITNADTNDTVHAAMPGKY